ncbi:polysaccharide export protein EpsE [Hymenobacter sp. HMF4947]|uniref:Polysaccharide export protein EpsE n=1 Tax=Hymenobacter ginkgonis TaxID=2682976 RepID=A0A7K1TE13_9BACT|nr:polysaccharide biosynthesis/export family protein [Hymenobacter ginkgonis]MVN76645.1 polysaccharide export protein EpsE [Hymenobacter ginkgonis]
MTLSPRFSFLRLPQLLLLALLVPCLLSSCATGRYYRQRTMFQLTKGADGVVDTARLRRAVNRTARNYLIKPNDYLNVQVYTNKGERLIDPNGELKFGTPSVGNPTGTTPRASSSSPASGGQRNVGQNAGASAAATEYLVQADGTVRLPLLDRVSVQGLSLIQADSVLQRRYNEYYKESFVKTSVSNNRVIVLGSPGGQVVTLTNDNMNLLEVLALAGGVDGVGGGGGTTGFTRFGGRVNNIRIIRGDLKNPQVQFVDLSTIEGMRRGNLQIEPNDIIYIQPVRRPFLEALTDATPVITLFFSVITTISLISLYR